LGGSDNRPGNPSETWSYSLLDPLAPHEIDVDLAKLPIGCLVWNHEIHEDPPRRALPKEDAKALPPIDLNGRDQQANKGIFAQINFHVHQPRSKISDEDISSVTVLAIRDSKPPSRKEVRSPAMGTVCV